MLSVPLSVAFSWFAPTYNAWPLASTLPDGVRTFLGAFVCLRKFGQRDYPTRFNCDCTVARTLATARRAFLRHIAEVAQHLEVEPLFSLNIVGELIMTAYSFSQKTAATPNRVRLCAAALLSFASLQAHAVVDLGDASVLSQQGQRLKVALVYGSGPGERVPVTRFTVAEVRADGSTTPAPKAELFTISAPERRNIVYLQSKEIVRADKVQIVMTAADNPGKKVVYDLVVPPAKSAATEVEPVTVKKAVSKKKRGKAKMSKAKRH